MHIGDSTKSPSLNKLKNYKKTHSMFKSCPSDIIVHKYAKPLFSYLLKDKASGSLCYYTYTLRHREVYMDCKVVILLILPANNRCVI
jgi:hypothetical protein